MSVVLATKVALEKGTGVAQYWARMLNGLATRGVSVKSVPLAEIARHATSQDIVIVDNHDCLVVPSAVACIAVQHGCAGAHFARCPEWPGGAEMAAAQREAAKRPRTMMVGCSEWAAHFGLEFTGAMAGRIIYGAVDLNAFHPSERQRRRDASVPVALHHCADSNKGSGIIDRVAAALKGEFEFRRLNVPPASVPAAMQGADIWLCLSAAEGLPTVVQEAMAVNLVVVGTDVGVLWPPYAAADTGATIFDWRKRADAAFVAERVREAWANRQKVNGRAWAQAWWGLTLAGQKWAECIAFARERLGVA